MTHIEQKEDNLEEAGNDRPELLRCFEAIKKKLETKEEGLAQLVDKLVSCLKNKDYVVRACNLQILDNLKSFDFETLDEEKKTAVMANLKRTIEDIEECSKRIREIGRMHDYLTENGQEIEEKVLDMVDDDIRKEKMTATAHFIRRHLGEMAGRLSRADCGVVRMSDLRDRLGVFETVYLGFLKKLMEKKAAIKKAETKGDQTETEEARKSYAAAKKKYENVLNHEGNQFTSYLRKCLEDDDFLAYEAGNSNTKIEKIEDLK